MAATLDGLFTDFISTTFRTFGQLPRGAVQEAIGGVDLDRHLTNLLADPPTEVKEAPQEGKSIILKPLSQLINDVIGKEPGTRAFAMARSKKPSKKKGATEPETLEEADEADTAENKPKASLKGKWTGTPRELESHLSQVWSFNLAHLMFEEEGLRDQGRSPSLRYFTVKDALHLNDLEGESKRAAWLLGAERPDKEHLELIVSIDTGKKRIKWAYAGIHLIISTWKPLLQFPRDEKAMDIVTPKTMAAEIPTNVSKKRGRPRKAIANEPIGIAEPNQFATPKRRGRPPRVAATTAEVMVEVGSAARAKTSEGKAMKQKARIVAKSKSPRMDESTSYDSPLLTIVGPLQTPTADTPHAEPEPLDAPALMMATKDEKGEDLSHKKRFFYFEGSTNPKARLSQLGLRKALLVLGEPSAEALLHKSDLVAIPPAFMDAAFPRTMVEVIREAQKLAVAMPASGPKPRRKPTEQKDMEELAQILINLEPEKTPVELAERMKHLMRYLDAAIAQIEVWEGDNGRKNGWIRQRWEKGKPRP